MPRRVQNMTRNSARPALIEAQQLNRTKYCKLMLSNVHTERGKQKQTTHTSQRVKQVPETQVSEERCLNRRKDIPSSKKISRREERTHVLQKRTEQQPNKHDWDGARKNGVQKRPRSKDKK